MRVNVPASSGSVSVDLPGVVGRGHALAALRRACSSEGFARAFCRRGRRFAQLRAAARPHAPHPGVKSTVIIDDTYNASPGAMHEALEVLRAFPVPERARRIALLGDMRELGGFTERAHREVGEYIAKK